MMAVQSMDEVHIVNLLRCSPLSKDHRRQIIIAVHERLLFDYFDFGTESCLSTESIDYGRVEPLNWRRHPRGTELPQLEA
jgi:hypothetical protein